MLNYALEEGLIKKNFANIQNHRMFTKKIEALSEEESIKLLRAIDEIAASVTGRSESHYLRECYRGIVYVALYSSARKGEILGLSWNNVNFFDGTITIIQSLSTSESGKRLTEPKTNRSRRTILIPKKCIKVLKEWKDIQKDYAIKYEGIFDNRDNLVFTNNSGHYVDVNNFHNRFWKKALEKAGISKRFTFHGLRHTSASILLKHGVNIKVVSERLGHSNVSVTMNVYQHLLPGMQETAVKELEKLF